MSDYMKHELAQVKPDDGIIRVKFVGDGDTRWLNITPGQYEAIKKVLEAISPEEWGKRFDEWLFEHYAVHIDDTGQSAEELYERWGRLEPTIAVDQFAYQYGLHARREI